jgi:hypothetical protein
MCRITNDFPVASRKEMHSSWVDEGKHKKGGKDWYYGLMKRYPELNLRKLEACSLTKVIGYNRENENIFYYNLERVLTKCKLEPEVIYNVD